MPSNKPSDRDIQNQIDAFLKQKPRLREVLLRDFQSVAFVKFMHKNIARMQLLKSHDALEELCPGIFIAYLYGFDARYKGMMIKFTYTADGSNNMDIHFEGHPIDDSNTAPIEWDSGGLDDDIKDAFCEYLAWICTQVVLDRNIPAIDKYAQISNPKLREECRQHGLAVKQVCDGLEQRNSERYPVWPDSNAVSVCHHSHVGYHYNYALQNPYLTRQPIAG